MKNDILETKQRPYWYVDAKWICGLFFMFILGLTLFVYSLYTITNKKNGIDTMTKMITLSFSRDGVDSTKDIDEFMKKIEASPDKTVKPIPTLNITVSKSEIEGKSAREIRYVIFRKIATPIYFNGKGAEEVLNTPEARKNFEKDTSLLRGFSESSHKFLGRILIILSIISAILLGLVVYFSSRFGRIANPGFIIVFTTWFWAIFFTTMKYLTAGVTEMKFPIPGEAGSAYGQMLVPFVKEILPDIMAIFSRTYFYALIFGLTLLIVAGILKLVLNISLKKS